MLSCFQTTCFYRCFRTINWCFLAFKLRFEKQVEEVLVKLEYRVPFHGSSPGPLAVRFSLGPLPWQLTRSHNLLLLLLSYGRVLSIKTWHAIGFAARSALAGPVLVLLLTIGYCADLTSELWFMICGFQEKKEVPLGTLEVSDAKSSTIYSSFFGAKRTFH